MKYVVYGAGAAGVMLYGTSHCAQVWNRFARTLSADFHVMYFYHREHGDSDAPGFAYTFDRLGLDLVVADPPVAATESDPEIDAQVARREQARREKDWAEADRIRDALAALGIEIVDTPDGARWRRR